MNAARCSPVMVANSGLESSRCSPASWESAKISAGVNSMFEIFIVMGAPALRGN